MSIFAVCVLCLSIATTLFMLIFSKSFCLVGCLNSLYYLVYLIREFASVAMIDIVGVDGVPREHLWGRSPFRCPVRGAEGARRADRGEHTGGLPRFGPRWMRKTLLLLGCIELGSSGAWRASCTERMAVWIPNLRTPGTPSTLHT